CAIVPALSPMAGLGFGERIERRAAIDDALATWLGPQTAHCAPAEFLHAGIPAAELATSRDLVDSDHLRERGFWDTHRTGVLPGVPWRARFERMSRRATGLGAHTD